MPLEYRVNGNWVAAQNRKEIINVKGKLPETLDVVVTRHGPVMSQQGNTGYALKWTATEPGGLAHSYFGMQFARNWKEFRESLRDAAGPGQNIVYADVEGHIGFIVAAKIPNQKVRSVSAAGFSSSGRHALRSGADAGRHRCI